MVWVYADDVYRFFPSYNWDKLSKVFDSVWTAGAFKGMSIVSNTFLLLEVSFIW